MVFFFSFFSYLHTYVLHQNLHTHNTTHTPIVSGSSLFHTLHLLAIPKRECKNCLYGYFSMGHTHIMHSRTICFSTVHKNVKKKTGGGVSLYESLVSKKERKVWVTLKEWIYKRTHTHTHIYRYPFVCITEKTNARNRETEKNIYEYRGNIFLFSSLLHTQYGCFFFLCVVPRVLYTGVLLDSFDIH